MRWTLRRRRRHRRSKLGRWREIGGIGQTSRPARRAPRAGLIASTDVVATAQTSFFPLPVPADGDVVGAHPKSVEPRVLRRLMRAGSVIEDLELVLDPLGWHEVLDWLR